MAELARDFTKLDSLTLTHLQRLVGSWGMLADLCFADLLLFVPVDGDGERFIVVGQMRPTTSQTLHREDLVGHIIESQRATPGASLLAAGDHRRGRGRDSESQRAGPVGVHPGAHGRPGGGRA